MGFTERLEADVHRALSAEYDSEHDKAVEVAVTLMAAIAALEKAHTSTVTSLHRRLEIVESRTKDDSEVSDDV